MRDSIFQAKPLHIALASLMLGLVVIFYLSMQSMTLYLGNERDLRVADDKVERVSRELNGVFDAELLPMKSAIKILAETPLVTGKTHEARLGQLGPMAAALRQNPSAGSVYAGTLNGSFVLMRNLKDRPKDRKTFNAPEEAMFLVQSVDRDKEDCIGYFYFYDAGLNLIQTLEKPEYQFDPRIRPWYLQAKSANTPDGIIQTVPYVFSSNQKIGITLATIGVGKEGVVGIDMSLTGLSRLVEKQNITPSAELVLFNSSGVVLAYRDASKIFKKNSAGKDDVVLVNELGIPALSELFEKWKTYPYNNKNSEKTNSQINVYGDKWYYRVESIDDSGAERLFLGVAIPYEELMADSIHMRNLSVLLGLVFTLLMMPAVFYTSKKISRPLRDLVKIANSIQKFDFSGPDPLRSSIAEVDNLALNMTSMKHTLKRFLEISGALSRESDFEKLINIILRETISISGAVGGSLILISNDGTEAKIAAQQFNKIEQDIAILPVYNLNDGENIPLEVRSIMDGCLKSIRVSRGDPLDLISYSNLFKSFDILNAHIVSLPLRNRSNEVLGSLVLNLPISPADYANSAPISSELLAFLDALSGTAAVAIDNQKMIQDQKILLESLIQLVAGAIDAKSPYSGSHCQRVPELTKMLAQAACEKNDGPFANFSLTEGDRETLHIASWLHDCGKVTTPEFVVDKATKLETIYDRIHEIRMRFEVLKRDAEISAYQEEIYKLPAETINMDELQKVIIQKCSILDEEFKFIATCNVGDEFMSPDKVERLTSIAQRRWLRTIDDSLGISCPELLRRKDQQKTKLPVFENLISDKPEHIFPRVGRDVIDNENNPWGFKISSPENLYNRGELYNLSIARGTLTNEERYKINEHIIQTIKMLSALPFPKHLSRVTEIAGGHHEKMDGTGYPYRLSQQEMSIEARIMAIADIFEALTAVDRPYKKGKTLSESIKIMSFMKNDQHIDADLFDLFIESGVYLKYANLFMLPEQIDTVDVASYLPSSQSRG